MYVITNHNEGNFVILGPIDWRPRYMSDVVSDEIDEDVLITPADKDRVPYEIVPGVKVRKCRVVYEPIDSSTQVHYGPIWEYHSDEEEFQITATWEKRDKPLSEIKSLYKEIAAKERWKKESKGITVNIQGIDVICDTSRGNRDIFVQKYSIMGENDTVRWKFEGGVWLNITKQELGSIVAAGATYIQSCFDWESNMVDLVEACTTVEELEALEISPKKLIENQERIRRFEEQGPGDPGNQ